MLKTFHAIKIMTKNSLVLVFFLVLSFCENNKTLENIKVETPKFRLSSILLTKDKNLENSSFKITRIENYSNLKNKALNELKLYIKGDSIRIYKDLGFKLAVHAYPFSNDLNLLKTDRLKYGFESYTGNLDVHDSYEGNYYSSKFKTKLNRIQYLIIYLYRGSEKIHKVRLNGVYLRDLTFTK